MELDSAGLRKLVEAVCGRFGVSEATVSIAVVDDVEFRKLNKRFLNRRGSSDCLSFDLSDEKEADSRRLFEVVVNGETAVREANLRGHCVDAEVGLYVTHGLLHNLGFDDSTEKLAARMHRTEDEILEGLGYGAVYSRPRKTKVKRARQAGRP